MKLSLFGRLTMALLASVALGLGMTACGGGTIGYMWVLGQQYNQIAGFKIDDFTGNLTTVPTSPFSTGGSVPVSIVVKTGGRFVYVINQGTGGTNKAIVKRPNKLNFMRFLHHPSQHPVWRCEIRGNLSRGGVQTFLRL